MPSHTQAIKCQPRTELGTKAARRLRRQGMIPAIIYGHQQPPLSIGVSKHDVEAALTHGRHLWDIELDGAGNKVLIKQVQYDHLGTTPIHLDLTRVSMEDRVEVAVHLALRGVPAGVKEGGVLEQPLTELQIECLVAEIPESIRVNVSELGINQSLFVRDIEPLPGVKVLSRPEELVASISRVLEEEAPEEEAMPAEPEVIGRPAPEEQQKEEQ